jgi:hypothetical protein
VVGNVKYSGIRVSLFFKDALILPKKSLKALKESTSIRWNQKNKISLKNYFTSSY